MSAPIQIDGPHYRRSRLRRCPTARALGAWLGVALLAVVAFAVLAGLPLSVGAITRHLGL